MVDGLYAGSTYQVLSLSNLDVQYTFANCFASNLVWHQEAMLTMCSESDCHNDFFLLQVGDFKTIVFRQKQLGFNAVRLPMTFSDLNLTPKIWTKACTDDTSSLKVRATPPSSAQSIISNPQGKVLSILAMLTTSLMLRLLI